MKIKLAIVTALMGAAVVAQGAAITWTPGTADNLGPDSVLDPTLVAYAGNANGSTLAVTSSGTPVTFDALPISGIPVGNAYIQNATGVITATDTFWTGGDANYDSIMNSQTIRVKTPPEPLELVLQNLTIGQDYQIQLFASDDNNSGNRTTVFSDAAVGGNQASELRLGDKDYVVGTFTAGAETQSVFAQTGSFPTNTAYISAFSLVAIPEPGTVALLGVGALVAMGARRRKTD